jgi:hypothetical protein
MHGHHDKPRTSADGTGVDEHPMRRRREGRKDAVVTRREFLELAIATTMVMEQETMWRSSQCGVPSVRVMRSCATDGRPMANRAIAAITWTAGGGVGGAAAQIGNWHGAHVIGVDQRQL